MCLASGTNDNWHNEFIKNCENVPTKGMVFALFGKEKLLSRS